MDLTRSVTPAPAVAPAAPTTGPAPATAGSNQALLASLGLGGGAAALPVDSLTALLPSLGPVGAVVLDALPVPTAIQLALTLSTVPWVNDWLAEADELSGRNGAAAGGNAASANAASAATVNASSNAAATIDATNAAATNAAATNTAATPAASATNADAVAGTQAGVAAAALASSVGSPAKALPAPFKEAPATQAEALARHVADEAKMARVLGSARSLTVDPDAGESQAAMLKNSVEWIDEGRASLHVLSLTHDGHLRPGGDAGKRAWFDTRAEFGRPATYDAAVDPTGTPVHDDGIEMAFAGVVGTMGDDGVLTIYGPAAQSEALLVQTIVHEVQHDADQTGGAWSRGQGAATVTDTAASVAYFEAYRSEFNAYWLETPAGTGADAFGPAEGPAPKYLVSAKTPAGVQTATTDFSNPRQASIFAHLHGPPPSGSDWGSPSTGWTTAYSYVPYFYVVDPAFRSMVDALDVVTSGNRVNSPRIQALWDAFASHDAVAVAIAAEDLDALDQATLGSGETEGDFWKFAKTAMPAEAAALRAKLRSGTSAQDPSDTCDGPADETTPGTITTQPGDTLPDLAARYLGDPGRSGEIALLNDLHPSEWSAPLSPGQRLRLPPQ